MSSPAAKAFVAALVTLLGVGAQYLVTKELDTEVLVAAVTAVVSTALVWLVPNQGTPGAR